MILFDPIGDVEIRIDENVITFKYAPYRRVNGLFELFIDTYFQDESTKFLCQNVCTQTHIIAPTLSLVHQMVDFDSEFWQHNYSYALGMALTKKCLDISRIPRFEFFEDVDFINGNKIIVEKLPKFLRRWYGHAE